MLGVDAHRSIQAARRDDLGRVGRARDQVRDGRCVVAAERAAERLGDPLARGLSLKEVDRIGRVNQVVSGHTDAVRDCDRISVKR